MRYANALTIAGLLTLTGCAAVVAVTKASFDPTRVDRLYNDCKQGALVIDIARAIPQAEVRTVAEFVGAYCTELISGSVPPTTDDNTITWLEQNIRQLSRRS